MLANMSWDVLMLSTLFRMLFHYGKKHASGTSRRKIVASKPAFLPWFFVSYWALFTRNRFREMMKLWYYRVLTCWSQTSKAYINQQVWKVKLSLKLKFWMIMEMGFFGILILGWLQKSSKRWKASYLTWLLTISWLEHCRQVTWCASIAFYLSSGSGSVILHKFQVTYVAFVILTCGQLLVNRHV